MKKVINSGSDKVFNLVNGSLVVLFFLIVLYPLIYVVSASVSEPDLLNAGKVWLLPKGVQFDGYRRVFQDPFIWSGYRNTIIYTVLGTAVNLIFTLTAAYPLSKKTFYGRNVFTAIFTFTMFFSGGLIPHFLLVKQLGMYDSMWALIIPSAVSMYNIIITRTFFQSSIPVELYESSSLDGCSHARQFTSIVLPLSAPIIAVMVLFYGVGHWNSYFSALIYLSDEEKFPLQLVLREILIVTQQMSDAMLTSGEQAEAVAKQMRVSELVKYSVMIVSSVPFLILYPLLQRYFVKGVMVGAIKG